MMPTIDSLPQLASGVDRGQKAVRGPANDAGGHPFGELLGRETAQAPSDGPATGAPGKATPGGNELQADGNKLPDEADERRDTPADGVTGPGAIAQAAGLSPAAVSAAPASAVLEPTGADVATKADQPLAPVPELASSFDPLVESTAPAAASRVPDALPAAASQVPDALPAAASQAPDALPAVAQLVPGNGPAGSGTPSPFALPQRVTAQPIAPGNIAGSAAGGAGATQVANAAAPEATLLPVTAPADSGALEAGPQAGAGPDSLFRLADAITPREQPPANPWLADQAGADAATASPPRAETQLPAALKPLATTVMTTPPGHPAWSGEMAGRINLMVNAGTSEASLQLSPPELGRLEIKITTDEDGARVVFTVQNAHAREAIENSMPRLREMLGQSGLQLAQSSVADQSDSQQRHAGFVQSRLDPADPAAEQGVAIPARDALVLASNSTVDYFV